jgi:hypothetical protein
MTGSARVWIPPNGASRNDGRWFNKKACRLCDGRPFLSVQQVPQALLYATDTELMEPEERSNA